MIKSKRKEIINGLRALKEECKKIPERDCHTNCPYKDICVMLRAVGYLAKPHATPDMWDFDRLDGGSE